MKTNIFDLRAWALVLGLATLTSSCANVSIEEDEAYTSSSSGATVERGAGKYDLSGFDAIEANGVASIVLTQDSAFRVEIKGDESIVKRMKIEQSGNKLIIDDNSDWLDKIDGGKCVISISMPTLRSLEVSGANSTKTTNTFIQDKEIDLDLSGAGSISLSIEAPAIAIDASGATSINLKGKADRLAVDMSGAGSVEAMDLETNITSISSSGAGSVAVWVNRDLKVDASGVGAVRYKGNPEVKKDISGMASVKKVDR